MSEEKMKVKDALKKVKDASVCIEHMDDFKDRKRPAWRLAIFWDFAAERLQTDCLPDDIMDLEVIHSTTDGLFIVFEV